MTDALPKVSPEILKRQTYRMVLPNGIVVLVVENPTADIIAARCFFKGGTRVETSNLAGISHLVSSLLTKGTINHSSQEIAEQIESIGASLGTEASPDYFLLSIKTISADFATILTLAAEILRSPTFPLTELELERRLTIQAIRSQQERPFSIAYDHLQKLMYGDHPYGFSALGTELTVDEIEQSDLFAYHQTHFRPDRMVISIAGRITPEQALALVEETFGDWQPQTQVTPPIIEMSPFQPKRMLSEQDTQQAIVMLGYRAPAVNSKDYGALKLITTYLGNGLSSRLFVELREKRGLAYEVSAFYPTRLELSQFVTYMGTAPHNADIALKGLKAECDRLIHEILDLDDLEISKSKLLGQYALGKQTNSQIAQVFGWYEVLELGVAFDLDFVTLIESVTVSEIQQAAQTYFVTPAVSVVGSAEALGTLV
ncbi:pitrilysin family protein [Tumidithrix helvetica PCC 7403]|uniref:M16 family metallopeptidase n=1 Tax=Tumidithrix helvetica TaxID=3457545 RepID=UPI003CA7A997